MLRKSFTRLIPLSIVLCVTSAVFAAPDAFQNALALYNKQNYQGCVPMLESYIRANPTNKLAYCYLANSYFALGRYDQAKKLAEYVIFNFTMTPESTSCGELIARIQAKTGSSRAEQPQKQVKTLTSSAAAANLAFNMDTFVYTVRGNQATGDVSPAFLKSVKSVMSTLPERVLARLQSSGCKLCVTPRMADKLPGFANQRPRGWDEDMSGKHVDGLFNGEVIICEHSISYKDDFAYVKNERYAGVLRHETGHAVDWYFGNLSETEELKHSYLLELARVDVDAREKDIAYYCQKSDAGRSECFAELFAAMMGGGCSKNDGMLMAAFTNTAKLIKSKLGI